MVGGAVETAVCGPSVSAKKSMSSYDRAHQVKATEQNPDAEGQDNEAKSPVAEIWGDVFGRGLGGHESESRRTNGKAVA
jgi:hypothetical protein